MSGAQAADEAPSVMFTNFGIPTLNRYGATAFLANVSGPGIVAGEELGLWSGGSGGIARSMRSGQPVPGDPTARFGGLGNPTLDAHGKTSLLAELKFPGGTPAPETVVVAGAPGAIAPLYRRGDTAPGLGGPTFNASRLLLLYNAAGQSAFNATVLGAGVTMANDGVIYREDASGDLHLVAREGDAAPGTAAGVNFNSIASDFVLNGAGQVAFHGTLTGPGIAIGNERGIWSEGGGELHLVARNGSQAPGAPAGSDFTSFLATGLQANDQGHVAFVGFSERVSSGSGDDQGIWSDRGGTLGPTAIDNQLAPGLGGGVFLTAFREVSLNSADQAAYIGALDGPGVNSDNSFGLWSEAFGGPRLVAREGSVAPGATDGAVFQFFEALAMNRWGQTAFYGTLRGTGVTTTNDNGLWAERIDGVLQLVVREGDTLEVAPGDTRTVKAIGLIGNSAGQDGRRTGFNDRGQIVTLARFTDESVAVLIWDDAIALAGDLNADGLVDAADYTVWRDGLGEAFTASDYETWRAHFGQAIGSGSPLIVGGRTGSNANAAVPEPASLWMAIVVFGMDMGRLRVSRRLKINARGANCFVPRANCGALR
jgi:hypothetical protein